MGLVVMEVRGNLLRRCGGVVVAGGQQTGVPEPICEIAASFSASVAPRPVISPYGDGMNGGVQAMSTTDWTAPGG